MGSVDLFFVDLCPFDFENKELNVLQQLELNQRANRWLFQSQAIALFQKELHGRLISNHTHSTKLPGRLISNRGHSGLVEHDTEPTLSEA